MRRVSQVAEEDPAAHKPTYGLPNRNIKNGEIGTPLKGFRKDEETTKV